MIFQGDYFLLNFVFFCVHYIEICYFIKNILSNLKTAVEKFESIGHMDDGLVSVPSGTSDSNDEQKKQNHDFNKKKYRIMFSDQENEKIKFLVAQHGTDSWKVIANNLPGRTPRQCRERWKNYLAPDINKNPWSIEEDKLLYEKYHELGPQWVIMTQFFTNRTQNNIKNRWNTIIRKAKTIGIDCSSLDQFLMTAQRVDFRSNKIIEPQHVEIKSNNISSLYSIRNLLA